MAGSSQPAGPKWGITNVSPVLIFFGFEKLHKELFPKTASHAGFTIVRPVKTFSDRERFLENAYPLSTA